jgi:hypothetical protein
MGGGWGMHSRECMAEGPTGPYFMEGEGAVYAQRAAGPCKAKGLVGPCMHGGWRGHAWLEDPWGRSCTTYVFL